jgi:hypothetical protein
MVTAGDANKAFVEEGDGGFESYTISNQYAYSA